MALGFEQEGLRSVPRAAKDPPNVWGARACKIRGSESPVVGRWQFTMKVVSGVNFPLF